MTFVRHIIIAQPAAIGVALTLAIGLFSRAEEPNAQGGGIEFFEKEVRPILVERCYECHSESEVSGGLRVDQKELLLAGGDSGKALIPGDPESSLLIEAIRYRNPDLQMPPKKPLTKKEVGALEKWILMGAPDPRIESVVKAPQPIVGMSVEDGRRFWSFQPISNPKIPEVKNRDWVRTPIDAFVLAKLESQDLAPATPADKRTLIRRVTFDLTGLPPTPVEIQDFLDDDSEEAYARVVERLLQSPRYGIRWGRHWLDVARYADSNGLDENLAYGNAWRYRDYVVNAFNDDKPFDRFLIEQIAGDLLPDADLESKVATGFLVLGAKVLAEPDLEKLIMDTIDEQLDTIGKAFWGMTFGCARCHDHKFDPLKQNDYYALAAIFKSTKTFGETRQGAIKHWNEHAFADRDESEQIKKIDADIAAVKKKVADFKRQSINKARANARSKGVDYLVAAAQLPPDCSLFEAETFAKENDLNSHVLHHACRYLSLREENSFFDEWRSRRASKDFAGIKDFYGPLFEQAEAAFVEAKKADPKATKLDDPKLEEARTYLYEGAGFLAIPSKPDFAFDPMTLDEYHRLSEEAWLLESQAQDLSSAMSVMDGAVQSSLPIHIRGSHRNLGAPMNRAFPEVMMTAGFQPILPRDESGRLELAQWMASPTHPLTARVYVNRLWRWHFGTGIVSSTENFGTMGDQPSHPELLDWLARYFIESNWSTKTMHRLIVMSSTYQMASIAPNDSADNHKDARRPSQVDPENRLLWKFPRQRLEVEQLRDSLLAIAGLLDESVGGKSIALRNRQFVFDHTSTDRTKYDSHRRSIYIPVIRNHLYSLFEQFDFPDPTMPTGSRNQTTIASQALFLMNSKLAIEASDALADSLIQHSSDWNSRIENGHQWVLGRSATRQDIQAATAFLLSFGDGKQGEQAERLAWSLYCQSLFASNEFIFVR